MRRRLLGVAAAAAAAFWEPGAAAQQVDPEPFSACLSSLDGEISGLEAVLEACPELGPALEEGGYLELLSASQREQFDSVALYELQQLVRRYERSPGAAPDPAVLDEVLARMEQDGQTERALGWFERFKRWLRELLSGRQGGDESFLARWLDKIRVPESVTEGLLVALVVLTIALAAAVLINEARAAGWLRRQGARRTRSAGIGETAVSIPALSQGCSDPASTLLRELAAALTDRGRLRLERSLTHRELGAAARLDNAEQRAVFERVALLAERAVYGARAPGATDEPILAAGRSLHAELRGARA